MIKKTPWRNGFIILNYTIDSLIINTFNNSFEIKPRTIVMNRIKNYVEACEHKKYVYVYFPEELKPFISNESEVVFKNSELLLFEIKYTKTDYDEYYTIIPPGHFLYDYVVLTSDELALVMSTKRRVFYERIDNKLVIYLV